MTSLPIKGKIDFTKAKPASIIYSPPKESSGIIPTDTPPIIYPPPEVIPTETPATSPAASPAIVLDPDYDSEDFDGAPISRVSSVDILKLDLNRRLQELSPLSPEKNVKKEASALEISLGLLSEDTTLSEERKQDRIINLFTDAVKRLETKRKTPEGSCVDRSPNLSNPEKKPLITISDNAEMLNYHYIWFVKENHRMKIIPIEDINEDIVQNYILKYSFPICHAYRDGLSAEEKKSIIDNEYLFIKEKVETKYTNVKFVQIPRLLYDLFIIFNIRRHEFDQLFKFFNVDANAYTDLLGNIGRKTRLNIDLMISINVNIIVYLFKNIGYSNMLLLDDFDKRRDLFIKLFVSFFEGMNHGILESNLKYSMDPFTGKVKTNDHFYVKDFNFDRFKTILFQSYLLDMGYMFDVSDENYSANKDKDKFILIRGDYGSWDAIWANKPVRRAHSNSYNNGLMNAIYSDGTAATLNYWRPTCHKKYYVIKKFIYGDDSDEDKIFFIPPIHPLLLLFSHGEFWHARTKVGRDYPKEPGVGGIWSGDGYEWGTEDKPIPDFLISKFTMNDIEAKYVGNYVDLPNIPRVVDVEYKKYLSYKNKYLKYKNKYLQLKNKLN